MRRAGTATASEPAHRKTHKTLPILLKAVRACRVCEAPVPLGHRPVLQAGLGAQVLIVGQAPGARVHASAAPWDDASGEKLRVWMGVDKTTFCDASQSAIIPMGYGYRGRGVAGDLSPRRGCADLWLVELLQQLLNIELTPLIGLCAQRHFLGPRCQSTLTETVRQRQACAPRYIPLPHPSPRNTPWFQAHPWFEHDLLPLLRGRVQRLLAS